NFSLGSAAPDVIELAGPITGSGAALDKTGSNTMVISGNNTSTYSGGTNVLAGTLQVASTSGAPLGTGPVTVAQTALLRLGGAGSLGGASSLNVLGVASNLGLIGVDSDSFDPAVVFGSSAKMSPYGAALQIATTEYNQSINMANIGNGNVILGATGVTADYLGTTL